MFSNKNSNYERSVPRTINEIVKKLKTRDYVDTIILIGSHARDDYNEFSDVDIVIIINKNLEEKMFSDLVSNSSLANKFSLLPYNREIFKLMYRHGNLFVRHVVTEGKILYDNGFLSKLKREPLPSSYNDSKRELDSIKNRLNLYDNPIIFNNLYVDSISRIYKIFSGMVITALGIKNEPQFNKEKALERFLKLYPNLKEDILSLNELKPFDLAKKGEFKYRNQNLPTISHNEFEDKIKRLRRMIHSIESEYKTD